MMSLPFPESPTPSRCLSKPGSNMLSTGIRTPVGIKILGSNLDEIEKIGIAIEQRLKGISGLRSVYAERSPQGTTLIST